MLGLDLNVTIALLQEQAEPKVKSSTSTFRLGASFKFYSSSLTLCLYFKMSLSYIWQLTDPWEYNQC